MDGQLMTLDGAVERAARSAGTEVLGSPRRFVAWVADLVDPGAVELRVLYTACDARYLSYFAAALERKTPEAMRDAAARAADYLHDERLIDAAAARSTSDQIAAGLSRARGIGLDGPLETPGSMRLAPIPEAPARRRADGWENARGGVAQRPRACQTRPVARAGRL